MDSSRSTELMFAFATHQYVPITNDQSPLFYFASRAVSYRSYQHGVGQQFKMSGNLVSHDRKSHVTFQGNRMSLGE